MIPCQRHLFDIPAEVAYLNCAYLSPLPNAVREAGITGVRRKASPWVSSTSTWFLAYPVYTHTH